MLLGVAAAVLALMGFDALFRSLGTPNFLMYFALGELGEYQSWGHPSRWWVWPTLGVVAVIQLWAVRSERQTSPDEVPR